MLNNNTKYELIKNTVVVWKTIMENKTITKKFNFKKNDIFIDELKYFISKVKSKTKIPENLNISNGLKTLSFALKLKKKFFNK